MLLKKPSPPLVTIPADGSSGRYRAPQAHPFKMGYWQAQSHTYFMQVTTGWPCHDRRQWLFPSLRLTQSCTVFPWALEGVKYMSCVISVRQSLNRYHIITWPTKAICIWVFFFRDTFWQLKCQKIFGIFILSRVKSLLSRSLRKPSYQNRRQLN